MIKVQVPLRVSLAGGGGDFPEIFENISCNIVSSTIDKFVELQIVERSDNKILIQDNSLGSETLTITSIPKLVPTANEIILNSIYQFRNDLKNGFSLLIKNDVTPGSGLGASSAICIGLTIIMSRLTKKNTTTHEILTKSFQNERVLSKIPGGIQDFFPALFGPNIYLNIEKGNINLKKFEKNLQFDKLIKGIIIIKKEKQTNRLNELRNQIEKFQSKKDFFAPLYLELSRYGENLYESILSENFEKICLNIKGATEIKRKISPEYKLTPRITKLLSSGKVWAHKTVGAGLGGHYLLYAINSNTEEIKKILLQEKLQFFVPKLGESRIVISEQSNEEVIVNDECKFPTVDFYR
jgi:D-glycero-alpha-D-manno-heptose-7-phosphate kinase